LTFKLIWKTYPTKVFVSDTKLSAFGTTINMRKDGSQALQ
jgi:hypothetical protein